jgi:hypothetical protein
MDGKSAYGLAQRRRDHGGDGTQASPAPPSALRWTSYFTPGLTLATAPAYSARW